eukprot:5515931-Pleurochrysis_carterae.AAC.1
MDRLHLQTVNTAIMLLKKGRLRGNQVSIDGHIPHMHITNACAWISANMPEDRARPNSNLQFEYARAQFENT